MRRFLMFCGLCWVAGGKLSAVDVVVSNLGGDLEASALVDSGGVALDDGDLVQLVRFPTHSPSELADLVDEGVEGIVAAMSVIDVSTVGVGSNEVEGGLEVVFQSTAGLADGEAYLLVFDAPTVAEAQEWALLQLNGAVPDDDIGGLDGFHSTHLSDAEVIVGEAAEQGLQTVAIETGVTFDGWISDQAPEGGPQADLLPSSDPDRDGRSNLVEFAVGGDPFEPDHEQAILIENDGAGFVLRYLRRSNTPGFEIYAEVGVSLDDWQRLASAEEPWDGPAPEGFEWVQQVMPGPSTKGFARLRIELE